MPFTFWCLPLQAVPGLRALDTEGFRGQEDWSWRALKGRAPKLQASFFEDRKALWVLPDNMYNKYVKGEQPLFTHLYGSSWHGDDAKSALWILHHPLFLAVLTLTGPDLSGIGGFLCVTPAEDLCVCRRL